MCQGYDARMRNRRAWLAMVLAAFVITDCSASVPSVLSEPVPSGPAPAGRITCTPDGVAVTSPVAALPDGVHFLVDAPPNLGARFEVDQEAGYISTGGDSGAHELVSRLGPGTYEVRCPDLEGDHHPQGSATVTIIDPAGSWMDDRVACPDRSVGINDYVAEFAGEAGDPVELFRRHLTGLQPGDLVLRAGYPAASEREVRVVRAGEVVGLGIYRQGSPLHWLLDTVAVFGSSGIRG
jgi:hypothetical protein